jgi:RHH-type proline utilization regulon transcriptional repressor/proline dehydrogenase/delta 1-pyrroline-5-carboxylate dehydrogenase
MDTDCVDRLPLPWGDEALAVARLRQGLSGALDWSSVRRRCEPWVMGVRAQPGPAWAMESLLNDYPLSSQEGLALMRLAEALLRIPDADTALALTADQLHRAPIWHAPSPDHQGLWQRLSHRVLDLAQRMLPLADHEPSGWIGRLGAQTVVAATAQAVGLLARQFVLGETLGDAMAASNKVRAQAHSQGQRLCMSFDMLGEGARTWHDADRYLSAYQGALTALQQAGSPQPLEAQGQGAPRDGLSIKLSALHPRFEPAHRADVLTTLLPRLKTLALQAAQAKVLLTLDAEESWRLELQLAVLDALLHALANEPQAKGWEGLGLAVQAYQLRAEAVIDEVAHLARQHVRRLTVRLVKGAYWDTEIKRAQELGLPGFPVFTHKDHTDLSYLACARRLLSQCDLLHPQLATHNAATVAAVMQLAEQVGVPSQQLEWQRLHGMGEATWREILADPATSAQGAPVLRIYAPVGPHRDLLPYLVRRLLENGANASFVHQLMAPAVPLDALLGSPLTPSSLTGDRQHADVTPPRWLHGPARPSAWGRDLAVAAHRQGLQATLANAQANTPGQPSWALVHRPPDTTVEAIEPIMASLQAAFPIWEATPIEQRCKALEGAALKLEASLDDWAAQLVTQAHKTWADAVAEVRETIDYARYYADQAHQQLGPRDLPGPTGERNTWQLRGRGVWVCISPWNFPLAIFGGQVMAALVLGNTVAAKPAEQTPAIALRLVNLLHECGVPREALALVPGPGHTVGAALVKHQARAGVAFTGSEATACRLQQALASQAGRPIVPLIAETGGINALIADSTALPEQLLDAVLQSAFGSAGQRCSSLRLLCLHQSMATAFEPLLQGALSTLVVGPPSDWSTDVGPVIDDTAANRLRQHLSNLAALSSTAGSGVRLIGQASNTRDADSTSHIPSSTWITPVAYTLGSVSQLTAEHFGPILHVVSWGPGTGAPTLDDLIDQINALGHGLTLGVHTRIDSRATHIAQRARVGNVYVNRSMTGATVGSQPFGGQGLSGTGPKAGGPLYLLRFATEQVVCTNTAAAGGNAALMSQAR